jgi:hypothetical protein
MSFKQIWQDSMIWTAMMLLWRPTTECTGREGAVPFVLPATVRVWEEQKDPLGCALPFVVLHLVALPSLSRPSEIPTCHCLPACSSSCS